MDLRTLQQPLPLTAPLLPKSHVSFFSSWQTFRYLATSFTFLSQEHGFCPTTHAPFSVWQSFHFRNTCFCKILVTYTSTTSNFTGSDTHSSWFILKDTGQQKTDSAHMAAIAGLGPSQMEFIFLTQQIRHVLKSSTSLTLFLFNYYAIEKMPNWYKSRNKLHSEIHCCYFEVFFENFLPDSNTKNPN